MTPLLSKDKIRKNLAAFAVEWADAKGEKQEAQSFWIALYACFGITRRGVARFEDKRKKLNNKLGYIDSFIPKKILVEHKSRGEDLDLAHDQASDYAAAIPQAELPRYIVVCDFAQFRLYDLDNELAVTEFSIQELPDRADLLGFLADYEPIEMVEENPINREAAYWISLLHDGLRVAAYTGRDLEIFLTRIVFCLFAEDTSLFDQDGAFTRLVEESKEDGDMLGATLAELFENLNKDKEHRQRNTREKYAQFTYINGDLFAERIAMPAFDSELRTLLLKCAHLNWGKISPAIFGAMFQGVLEHGREDRSAARRELGAHYTSEKNILRTINPLFMDALRVELAACGRNAVKLKAFHDKLVSMNFFDPACGCGNFLVIAYREVRLLEMQVIAALYIKNAASQVLDIADLVRVNVHQFHGIEIDGAAAHIARVALWITDHQMNREASARFGAYYRRLPLLARPNIVHENALRADWASVLPPASCHYILGNPPFIGKQYQSAEQKRDLEPITGAIKGAGVLDYVAAWYLKAAAYLQQNEKVRVAFVSTNSISQGEQVGILWAELFRLGMEIQFAHRTFQWTNEGKGVAAVHCVIIGFGRNSVPAKTIFEYDDIAGDPTATTTSAINPYLVDAPNVILPNRKDPLCAVSPIVFGSMPNDGGFLILSNEEKTTLLRSEPQAKAWIRPFLGAEEFLNNKTRWCLWLDGISAGELKAMPSVHARVTAVAKQRRASPRAATQALADFPTLFGEIRQPTSNYLFVPSVSSERREFIPIGFMSHKVIASNLALVVPCATMYEFGVLSSTMHNAWMRTVCGRLKSDYRYSAGIVYNNYAWPIDVTPTKSAAVVKAAEHILIVRSLYKRDSLADMYSPDLMPVELKAAHRALDKAVDAAYGYRGKHADTTRAAYLFRLYEKLTSNLLAAEPVPRKLPRSAAL